MSIMASPLLTAVLCQWRIKTYNEKHPMRQNVIKLVTRGHVENSICQVFTYSSTRWHFHRTNCMPNIIMKGLDSTGTNNLTYLAAQCTRVLYHKAQLKDLNWGAGTPFSMADTTVSLHIWLSSRYINTVGKRKQLHVLTAGLVSVRNDTWIIREY